MMRVDDFDFSLPEERIALSPARNRVEARLLHVGKEMVLQDRHIHHIPELLQPGDVLVCNNTRVIPARLYGRRDEVLIEVTLHKPREALLWSAFARPARKLRCGDVFEVSPHLRAEVCGREESGEVLLRFTCDPQEFFPLIERYGVMPLPPYIAKKRAPGAGDREDYQTVFARHAGAVAAPTAGLHFTPGLLQDIKAKGVEVVEVTLHVGGGTFLPIKVEHTTEHVMHSEYGEVSAEAAACINQAKKQGGRVVAIGTTSLRILESATAESGELMPFAGETDIFITPGYRFRCVDAMVTNFHLPRSTLFMLVCAFSGIPKMKEAYQHAIESGYRFYSYGDACFLERA